MLFHPHSCIGESPTVCRTGPSRLKEVTRRREVSHALRPEGVANPKAGDAVAEVSSSSSP